MAHKDSAIEISEYTDVIRRAEELGCISPTEFAVLPRNFDSAATKADLLHEDTAPTVRILLREAGIQETRIEPDGERFPYIKERSLYWIGPILLVGASAYAENPQAISLALSVIANYLTDLFRGSTPDRKVRLEIIVPEPRTNKYQKIKYEGDVLGLKDLPEIIKEVRNGRTPRGKRKGSR